MTYMYLIVVAMETGDYDYMYLIVAMETGDYDLMYLIVVAMETGDYDLHVSYCCCYGNR